MQLGRRKLGTSGAVSYVGLPHSKTSSTTRTTKKDIYCGTAVHDNGSIVNADRRFCPPMSTSMGGEKAVQLTMNARKHN